MIPSVREYYRFYGLDAEKLASPSPTPSSCIPAR